MSIYLTACLAPLITVLYATDAVECHVFVLGEIEVDK
jgi:hypothetical protein